MTNKIVHEVKELIDTIKTYLGINKTDVNKIPMMKYPDGYTGPKPEHTPPWTLNNRSHILRYRHKR